MRVIFFAISQVLFWIGIATDPEKFFAYITSWALTLTMITFTLLVLSHIFEFYDRNKSEDGQLVAYFNPYSPSFIDAN
jgi:hypothetical protein